MNLDSITESLGKLYGLPGYVLVFLLSVAVCKGLRSMEKFPNSAIWLVLILLGAALNLLIADPNSSDPTTAVITSFRVWIGKSAILGGIIGYAAFLSYNSVLRRLPFFSGDDDAAERKAKREADAG